MSNIAIAHKDYNVRGGGERVAEALSKAFDCPLYVGTTDRENKPADFPNQINEIDTTKWVRKAINRGGLSRKLGLTLLWRQDATELYEYDTIILSGAQPRWFKPKDDQTLISYTHATPRDRTDLWHTRTFRGVRNRLNGLVSDAFELYYRPNVNRPDVFVCNSELVERRVQKYWGVPASKTTVVYPPVNTESYSPTTAPTKDYYFSVSRLDSLKQYDDVIRAFQNTDRELKIAGTGPEQEQLEALAAGHENIELLGYISEKEKRKRLSEARAFVFNAVNEDFGIAPIEAFASGTPVIGINDGFTKYQILNGENGIVYENILEGVYQFETHGVEWTSTQIAEFANQNFSLELFKRQMRQIVELEGQKTDVNPGFREPKTGCKLSND